MPSSPQIRVPNEWTPRLHQRKLWRFMSEGGTRGVAVWHRRAGKDSTALNVTCWLAHQRRGTYWHMLPEQKQGRKVVWDAIDGQGRRVIDQVFPKGIRESTNEQEMQIKLKCGSVWQVVGSDNYDSLVGANPIGVVMSEYSVAKPAAWNYIRPILAENGGWALFIYTPRGGNHGKKLFDMARKNPGWFCELLTVDDTHLISPAQIQAEIDAGMEPDMVQQEFFCSFDGSTVGSIYADQLRAARADGRIGKVPYDRRYPVNTFWDLGHSDGVAIVFHQKVGMQDRFIRGYEAVGKDLSHYVGVLREQPYVYGSHYLPHDAKNVTLAAANNPLGKNAWEQLVTLGISPQSLKLVPRTSDLWASINATRIRMDTCWWDEEGCEGLLAALHQYQRSWNEDRNCFADAPKKDWSSEYADAFRQWAQVDVDEPTTAVFSPPKVSVARLPESGRVTTIGDARTGY